LLECQRAILGASGDGKREEGQEIDRTNEHCDWKE
jgi:hypothetical protein